MKLSDLVEVGTVTGIVTYKAHANALEAKFGIKFNLSAFTPAWELKESIAKKQGDTEENQIVALLLNVLVWMDLTDDDNRNIPVTRENLMNMPFGVLSAILDVINESAAPEKKPLSASGGSFQA